MSNTAVTADGRARLLADGNQMPMLGLGVWQVPNGPECAECPAVPAHRFYAAS